MANSEGKVPALTVRYQDGTGLSAL